MFWVKQLKSEEQGTAWELSYADLMSLLMAVFMMTTAMGELRNGRKFGSISQGVRNAFGFAGGAAASVGPGEMSFVERLRRAGLQSDNVLARETDGEVLSPCDINFENDEVIIRVAGSASFNPESPRLKPVGQRALLRISQFLVAGQNEIEIRGRSETVSPGSERDELELSYQRARAVADLLTRSGINRNRLRLTASGNGQEARDSAATGDDRDRAIEIVLHSIPAAKKKQVAEKEQL
jgi:chemotaxis protein MotB